MSRSKKPSTHSEKNQRQPRLEPPHKDGERPRALPPNPLHDLTGDLDELLPMRPSTTPRYQSPRTDVKVSSSTAKFRSQPAVRVRDDQEREVPKSRHTYTSLNSDYRYTDDLLARPYTVRSAGRRRTSAALSNHPIMLIIISILSIIVLLTDLSSNNPILSGWTPLGLARSAVENNLGSLFEQPNPPGDYNLRAAPSLNPQQIDTILENYGSPATGTGQIWVEIGRTYQIDPAFAVAFFIHESSAGTNPGWAGMKPDGTTTHNVGNIICAGYSRCHGRFRDYASWEEGIEDWYRLIDVEYIRGRGTLTVEQIIPIYAPAFENDVQGYVRIVEQMVDNWRMNGVQ